MPVGGRVVAVLMAALALTSCTAGAATTNPQPSAAVVAAQAGSDVGNDRPRVTYDGLMVRRRVVIAIHSTLNTDLASLRKELDLAATRRHTTLSTISASVLDPAVLERLAPDVVVVLPAGTARADAGKLMHPAFAEGRRITDRVQQYDIVPVLVHDLRFTIGTATPAALARAIAREGILSDALGNYTTALGTHELDIAYTGPLLSDHLVESVRTGIARPAHVAPGGVTVSPRSTTGTGVDMATEPAQKPAPAVSRASAGHHHSAASPTPGGSSDSNPWIIPALGVLALLSLTLVRRRAKRIDRSDKG